jgi:anti-sigma factor ChrR (cupin superfamily)
MNDQPRDDMPALLRATAPRPGPAGPDCLDQTTIAAVVDGTLDPDSRTPVIQHLASCARCRAAVAGVSRILSDTAVSRAVVAVERPQWARRWHVPVGVAAAAALALLLAWPRQVDDGEPVHRAPTITATPEPVPMSPVGAVADAAALSWAAVAGADRYRVTLFDADGRVVFETLLRDTVASLPDSVTLRPGRPYLWKVEARTGWDRWASSPLIEFTIVPGGPR